MESIEQKDDPPSPLPKRNIITTAKKIKKANNKSNIEHGKHKYHTIKNILQVNIYPVQIFIEKKKGVVFAFARFGCLLFDGYRL